MIEMNQENWIVDDASINSKDKIYVPLIDKSISVWFEIEEGKNCWSESQRKAFNDFGSLGNQKQALKKNRIVCSYSSVLFLLTMLVLVWESVRQ